jgi:hypothetical protein
MAVATAIAMTALAGPAAAQDGAPSAWNLTTGKPGPCAELTTSSYPAIGGGCNVYANAPIVITVRTMFGPLRFGRCEVGVNVLFGPTGVVWVQSFESGSAGACGDMLPCREKASPTEIASANKLPWKGRVVEGSIRPRSEFDLCLDTCMGKFEGRIAFDLVQERGDLTLRAKDSVAGDSGLELDGEWDLNASVIGPDTTAYVKREGRDAPGLELR